MIDTANFKDPNKGINEHEDMNLIRNIKRYIIINKKR